ncbi:30S ribosomal protein S12 methylthiotransferase RimO [Labilibaculum sp. A4]|uniref:30S ribosomal protein S12 methylthiotransferase RimO n=1 Tax=Labilibaculum euxinus TaxID=2686357 RepID=UPI000F618813|nr:30S ribosomal protein S12 methylthiotransferase RimO [Labilibaculum euxinus]MDQ1770309.1 30S ribosomal protein S12 methylthiotransferase RimO [Labilibaculum euxinus]MWN75472.1 30S ribosomal protein S12 methylthiotransferase RimO [Labilibaculum euxinus]
MNQTKINIVSLGCSKNLVDTELLMKQLDANQFQVGCDEENSDARTIIINTCGFIGDAKEESIDMILQYVEAKKAGKIDKLFVMGCLSERYRDDLVKEIPEVDHFFGKFEWQLIVKELNKDYKPDFKNFRMITTPKHFAYLKISEGCNRSCSYCAIPIITGKHVSRPMEDILEEARGLVKDGVKELLVIAQDLSYYGYDLYNESKLAELVQLLSEIDGLEWIKLHYAYPTQFPYGILKLMRENPKVCRYLDIALQHSSDNVLNLMRRGINREKTIELIAKIRAEVPGITLRTTMLVGHPGETEADMKDLMAFVSEMKFERLGVFPYSNEDDTYAAINYDDNIPLEIKESRRDDIMALQQEISRVVNEKRVGEELKVVIDRKDVDFYYGRTEFDSYEVDPEVLIPTNGADLKIGEFYTVRINDFEDYDLFGEII